MQKIVKRAGTSEAPVYTIDERSGVERFFAIPLAHADVIGLLLHKRVRAYAVREASLPPSLAWSEQDRKEAIAYVPARGDYAGVLQLSQGFPPETQERMSAETALHAFIDAIEEIPYSARIVVDRQRDLSRLVEYTTGRTETPVYLARTSAMWVKRLRYDLEFIEADAQKNVPDLPLIGFSKRLLREIQRRAMDGTTFWVVPNRS